jgi:hypothetical protein
LTGSRLPAPETVSGLRRTSAYLAELTSVRAEVRGSDLGDAGCGGYPHFNHFVLEAQAVRDPEVVAGETGVAWVGPDVPAGVRGAAGRLVNILTFGGGSAIVGERFSAGRRSRSLRYAHLRVTEGAVNYE